MRQGRTNIVRRSRLAASGGVLIAALAGVVTMAADSPTGGTPGVRAFVLSNIYFAGPQEEGVCKTLSAGTAAAFALTLPKDEQVQYAAPEKRQLLVAKMHEQLGFRRISLSGRNPGGKADAAKFPADYERGEKLTPERVREIAALNAFPRDRGSLAYQDQVLAYDSCTNPGDFPQLTKGYVPYDGKTAFGMDLDGKQDRHDFNAPDGTRGVDNQLWRAIGCTKTFREQGDPQIAKGIFLSARAPTLIELRGVDDLRNDGDVTVNILSAVDPVTRDGRKLALAHASFRADPDPRFRATTHGRIVDGVLTTDPVDLRINYKEQILDSPRALLAARIRLVFQPDGSVEGGFYGYYTLESFYRSIEQMTLAGADVSGISCPAVRRAIDRYADGGRDPRTGRFTAISSAMQFFGVPAFIIAAPESPAPRS